MVSKKGPEEISVVIRFGAGLYTNASEEDIDVTEAADGKNFLIDLQSLGLEPRAPFDLVGTAPNGAEIRGGGSFLKADGTVEAFFQAGNKVYEWDGQSFEASPILATVNASAKLRGHWRSHIFALDDLLLITDLSLLEKVKSWDGTTWTDIAFKSSPSTSFGNFFAKYCSVSNERALFANIKDAGGTFPHLIVGSLRSDYTRISVSNRPSSSLSDADPFFLLTPDLRPVNGLIGAFSTTILSTQLGQLFNLTGTTAQDFAFADFYPGSGASGEESLAYVGNDIIYGRQGRIESVRDTNRFGESEADDITRQIADVVLDYTGWRAVYNSRLHRVYLFPSGVSEVWVYNTSMGGSTSSGTDDITQTLLSALSKKNKLSPWMRWATNHSLAFQPTFVMSMLDPSDGLEYVFMGDSSGRIYRMEGSGSSGDGGTTNIEVEYLTKLFSVPLNEQGYDYQGYIKYRKGEAATVEIIFEYAGEAAFNESITVEIPATTGGYYYGGQNYYNGIAYFGSAASRLVRQPLQPPGQGNEFQIRIKQAGTNSFSIAEIGFRFKAASSTAG